MRFLETHIKGCFVIAPELIEDNRGKFFRSFCEDEFREITNEQIRFVQMNHSVNHKKGTFRGMHFQKPPYSEGKLIKCIRGSVLDTFLDIRKGSPTFLEYEQIELSEENKKMIYLCKGIAHGFLTLEDNTDLLYHHTEFYNKHADNGIRYDDPVVEISLPVIPSIISNKDQNYSLLTHDFKGI